MKPISVPAGALDQDENDDLAAAIAYARRWLALAYLHIGNLLDLRGERRSAKRYYRKALDEAGAYTFYQWYGSYPAAYVGDASTASAEKGRVR